jgi:hypothetical protein
MSKQIDFALRVRTLNPGGVNGGYTPENLTAWVKSEYPFEDGWKVENVLHTQTSADGVSVLLFLARYADDSVSVKTKKE